MKPKFTLPLILICAVLAVGVGCKKAAPETPADPPPPPPPPPVQVVEPPPPPPVEDRTPDPLDGEVVAANMHARDEGLIGDIYFAFDKYDLTEEAHSRLSKNADFLKGRGSAFEVTIEGHCDERGTNDYNIALGDRRANAAKDYIVSLGVTDDRVSTLSYGEERPVCSESDESCWSKNRRAEFHLTGKR